MPSNDELAKLKELEKQIHEAMDCRPLIEEKQQTASEIMATMRQKEAYVQQQLAERERGLVNRDSYMSIPGVETVGLKGNRDIGEITVVLDLESGEQIQIKLGDMIHPDQIQVLRDMAETGLGNVDRPRSFGEAAVGPSQAFIPNKWGDELRNELMRNMVDSAMLNAGPKIIIKRPEK